jgi:N-acetylglucosamine kinase-like BadF-type ATPase
VARAIGDAVKAAMANAGLENEVLPECGAVCGGFAGAGRTTVDSVLKRLLSDLFPKAQVLVVPDFRIAFEGATQGNPGVVVIAGTGSIVYGRGAAGVEARAGGWGPDVSDEGGGFRIGREAVAAVLEAHDGRRPATALRQAVLDAWQVADEDGLIDKMRVDLSGGTRPPFPVLLPAVVATADRGDAAARQILERAGRDLAALAIYVAQRVKLATPLIAWAGGVFQNAPAVRDAFTQEAKRVLPQAVVEAARESPVEGAVRLALNQLHDRQDEVRHGKSSTRSALDRK